MNLPAEFIANIQNTFRERGNAFLEALPLSISEAAARWGLTDVIPSHTLSYNFVAFARRGDENVVLKMGVPNREFLSEMEALRLFNGEGACKLLEYDEERYWILLERLSPGEMLVTLKDDDEATRIAADVMKKIWRPLESASVALAPWRHSLAEWQIPSQQQAVALHKFILLSDWFDALKRVRPMFHGGTGPICEDIFQRVERWLKDAFAENHSPVLMHGDFHHYNILSSERGWLIIDPKGVIGPAGYEVGPLLMNPWSDFLHWDNPAEATKRRIDILHEHLGFERERLLEWGLAHAVLSACWSTEDNIRDDYSIPFAEMIADLEIK